jgi:protein TonB
LKKFLFHENRFEINLPRAIILSILFHLIVLLLLPLVHKPKIKPPQILNVKIEVAQKETPKPEPVKKPEPMPQPIKKVPEPPKPKPVEEKKVEPQKLEPQKVEPKEAPKPIEKKLEPTPPPPPATPNEKKDTSAKEKPTPPPQDIIKPADLTQEVITGTTSPEKIKSAKSDYSNLLASAISKYKQYPKLAQVRGWQGIVIVEIEMSPTGAVLSMIIKKSSGYDILDAEAMQMIQRAMPLPQPPESLKSKNFTVLVPVSFQLN